VTAPGTEPASARPDVVLAYVHAQEVAHSWHAALLDLVLYDAAHDHRLSTWIAQKCHAGNLIEARNLVASQFLETDGEWLFILDTDMGFAPGTLDALLEVADPVERPIVGALCFAWLEAEPDGLRGYRCRARPTIFQFTEGDNGERVFAAALEYPPNTVVQCAGTGSACILIHRNALEAIGAEYGPTWYDKVPAGAGRYLSEDLSMCARAAALGFSTWVHTGVPTNHQKTTWVGPADHPPTLNVESSSRVHPRQGGKSQPPQEVETGLVGAPVIGGNRATRRQRKGSK